MKKRVWRYAVWFAVWIQVFTLLLFPRYAGAKEELTLYARSAVLMDGDSGRILYGKEASLPLPMASTTKIMTCILALENASLDTVCTVSEYAASQPQVKLGMRSGDTFYLEDLLYSLMLESHNDTAVCIAETVAGSVEAFAEKMNQKAAGIGCLDTHYVTPNGLDGEDGTGVHHTTASELALVMRYCITQSPKAEEFLKITGTPSYTFTNCSGSRSYGCTNHNAFLNMMEGAVSGKTGFTGDAGYCYVGALQQEDKLFIVALLACGWPNNKGYKWVDTKKLMNYGLEQYEKRDLTGIPPEISAVPVLDGQQEAVAAEVRQQPLSLLLRRDETVSRRVELVKTLEAPVQKGQRAGTVTYLIGGEAYVSYPILTTEAVERVDYAFFLRKMAEAFLI